MHAPRYGDPNGIPMLLCTIFHVITVITGRLACVSNMTNYLRIICTRRGHVGRILDTRYLHNYCTGLSFCVCMHISHRTFGMICGWVSLGRTLALRRKDPVSRLMCMKASKFATKSSHAPERRPRSYLSPFILLLAVVGRTYHY